MTCLAASIKRYIILPHPDFSDRLLLADTKVIGGEVKIHCHGFYTGTVSPGGYGLIEKITTTLLGTNNRIHCVFDKAGGCNSINLLLTLAVHLPWLTLLKLFGTEVRDLIEKDPDGGSGNPGWKTACQTPLQESVDECTAAEGSTALANVAAGVEATFEAISQKATCSIGGAGAGDVKGFDLIESPAATEKLTFD